MAKKEVVNLRLADPFEIKLGENLNVPKRVQLLRIGTFFDNRYGKVEITPDKLLKMKENFDSNVRKIQLAVDYKHDSEDIAAGWIKAVFVEKGNTELWAEVEWTKKGETVLGEKEFRYVSADFRDNYIDNETLQEFGPTLMGAGLTNRPVVKEMVPLITLSESKGDTMTKDEKDKKVADLKAQLADLTKDDEPAADDKNKKPVDEEDEEDTEMSDDMKKKMKDMQTQLAAANAKIADYQKKEQDAAEAKKLADKEADFSKMLSEGKVVKAQKEAFLKGDMAEFLKLAEPLKTDVVGNGSNQGGENKPAHEQIIKLAEDKIIKKEAKNQAEAISKVLREQPELAKAYYAKK